LPNTAILALFAIIIAIVFGIIFGIISALHKDSWIDRVIALISTLGMSIPSFQCNLVCMALWICSAKYTHLNMTGSLYEVDDFVRAATFNGKYCFACNCIGNSSTSCCDTIDAQLLLETLGQDYIRTARAKGLSEFQIIRKHAKKTP
jgi:peptide/nickel transport system permease protein